MLYMKPWYSRRRFTTARKWKPTCPWTDAFYLNKMLSKKNTEN